MQRKKKLFLISMTLILLLFVVVNVIKNNKYIKYNDMYTNNNQKIEMEYIDLSELEKSAAETITNLEKGIYSNLLADNLHVTLSDAKNVSKIFKAVGPKEYRHHILTWVNNSVQISRICHYIILDNNL